MYIITCKYHGLQNMLVDLGTFNVHVLGSDIFIEIYTRKLNDIFHTIVLVTVHQKYFLRLNKFF